MTPDQIIEACDELTSIEERQVVEHLIAGYGPKQIAEILAGQTTFYEEIPQIAAWLMCDGDYKDLCDAVDIVYLRKERKRKSRLKKEAAIAAKQLAAIQEVT